MLTNVMTKQQAAQFLDVEPATIDAYVAIGRLKKYPLDLFNKGDLEGLKSELAKLKPSIQPPQQPPSLVESLLSFFQNVLSNPSARKVLIELAKSEYRRRSAQSRDSYKGALTVRGAANSQSKASESTLRKDIKAGKLQAKEVDGVLKIKRSDLSTYLKKEWSKD